MGFDFNKAVINYIQVSYKLSDTTLCTYKAGLHSFDEKTLIVAIKTDEDIKLSKSQELIIDIVCTDGLYKGSTILKYFKRERQYIYLFLTKPLDLRLYQNREYFRVAAQLDCICLIKENGRFNQYSAETLDISANGVCILLNKWISSNDTVTLVLNINNKKLNITANLVRIENFKEKYKASFMYSQILEQDRDSIAQFCIQKQLQDRRNQLM